LDGDTRWCDEGEKKIGAYNFFQAYRRSHELENRRKKEGLAAERERERARVREREFEGEREIDR
jgi:hypothetical protein